MHGTAAFDGAIATLLFATFALVRRRYGYAIMFLTPIVMLLIGAGSDDPWIDLADASPTRWSAQRWLSPPVMASGRNGSASA